MNQQHIDSRLNESQLEENFGQHSSEEDRGTTFKLTVPYQESCIEPKKYIPGQRSYLFPKRLSSGQKIDELIQTTYEIVLKYMLKERGFELLSILEITSIKPRIYEEDQSSLDNKFKLNAYQVEGRLECKL